MGIAGLDQFDLRAPHIPFVPVNHDLAGKCYIIILDPDGAKNAHMGILIDLAGMSTNTKIIGILAHTVANIGDEQVPHSTDFEFHAWSGIKSQLIFKYVGELCGSKYLFGNSNIQLPLYLAPPTIPAGTHEFIANPMTPIVLKRSYLHHLGSSTYYHMASQYQPIWSSNMNCQKFARLFLTEGLGLIWPEEISVAGDVLPVVIDINLNFFGSIDLVICALLEHQIILKSLDWLFLYFCRELVEEEDSLICFEVTCSHSLEENSLAAERLLHDIFN